MVKSHSAKKILERVKSAYQFDKDGQLASFLEVPQSTLSSWKGRDSLDYRLLFEKCESLNFNYLIFGEGPIMKKDLGKQSQGSRLKYALDILDGVEKKPIKEIELPTEVELQLARLLVKVLERRIGG